MDLLALAASFTVMAAIVVGLFALYQNTASPRGTLERRLGSLLAEPSYEATAADLQALRPKRLGRIPIISSFLQGKDSTGVTAAKLEGADMGLTVSEYVAVRIFLGMILGLITFFMFGGGGVGLFLLLIVGFVGYLLPEMYLNYARGKRIRKLNDQLVDTLVMIANSLKAGFGLMQSFDMAGRELEHPIATELRRTLSDINVGSTTEEALQALAKRSGSDDMDIAVTAMLIQQQTGGNLSEILDNVAHTMRERIRIRGEIKTLTTQQMATGFVIGALPLFLMVFIHIVNPSYMSPLFHETIGIAMLVCAGVLEFFGIMVIKKILAIEV